MLERTDATTNDVLEPTTLVLAYPTVYPAFLCHDTFRRYSCTTFTAYSTNCVPDVCNFFMQL